MGGMEVGGAGGLIGVFVFFFLMMGMKCVFISRRSGEGGGVEIVKRRVT